MKSKWEARDLGRAQSSELFRIITGPESNFRPLGFAITLPVYKRGFVPGTLDSRRADLLGYMAGVYAVRELLKEQIDELVAAGFSIDIHDHMDNENRLVIEAGTASIHSKEIDIDLFGNNLHFRLIATEDFVSSQFHPLWVTLPSALIVFGALIFVFLHQLEKKNNRLANAQVELHKLNERLEELSRLDPLTSLFNRRAFIEAMNQELGRMQRHQGSLALLMLDLDHFKQINDRWGHPAGDKMLVEFSRVCRESSRNIDILGRLGGEEFAILLVETDREEALQFAERLRKRVSELSVRVNEEGAETGFTVSIGLSQIDQPMAVNKWVEQADKALYWAKHSGRDCVREYDA